MPERMTLAIIVIFILTLFCSCGDLELAESSPYPLPSFSPGGEPSPELGSEFLGPVIAVSKENEQRENTFRNFIDENYDSLSAACFGGIAGVGFIDLDLDGCIEMLLFDAGASASMGVQFFDVFDDKVECVSANMSPMAEAFGGEHITDIVVNANYFDDFRLMESADKSQRFFQVVSFNGAADFSYHELIRFGSTNGVLTLNSLAYICEDFDIDSGEVLSAEYKLSGKACTSEEYYAALDLMAKEATDTGLEAKGVFMWEDPSYAADKAGLLAMTDAALKLSRSSLSGV